MMNDISYQRLLKRMLLIESLGCELYSALTLKTQDANLKKVYQGLADNEDKTVEHIRQELLLLKQNISIPGQRHIVKIAKFVFHVLSEKQLSLILYRVLKKRMYSSWFAKYHHKNEEVWKVLLGHENVQHKLLTPFWSKKMGGVLYGQRKGL